MQRFRGGLVFKADRLFVSLNSRLESNKEEEEEAMREAASDAETIAWNFICSSLSLSS